MDFKEIKELIKIFDKSEADKLRIKEGNFEILLQSGSENNFIASPAPVAITTNPSVQVASQNETNETNETKDEISLEGETIKSPMVGTFYASPSPEAGAFVKIGDKVSKGQTLCILEAMKIMNEVEAEFDCKIVDILIKDSDPVEYDMPLFVIERI